MPSNKNQQQIEIIKEKLEKAKALFIIDYSGTNASEQVELRSAISEAGGEMFVTKNTLVDIALDKKEFKDSLTGMNALVFSNEDVISALKKVYEFHDEHEKLEIKQGLLIADDQVLNQAEVEKLSKMPGKEELLVKLLRQLQAPAHGLVNVLNAGQRDLVYVLKAIADKQQEAAA